jgi:hypothetical protein
MFLRRKEASNLIYSVSVSTRCSLKACVIEGDLLPTHDTITLNTRRSVLLTQNGLYHGCFQYQVLTVIASLQNVT